MLVCSDHTIPENTRSNQRAKLKRKKASAFILEEKGRKEKIKNPQRERIRKDKEKGKNLKTGEERKKSEKMILLWEGGKGRERERENEID